MFTLSAANFTWHQLSEHTLLHGLYLSTRSNGGPPLVTVIYSPFLSMPPFIPLVFGGFLCSDYYFVFQKTLNRSWKPVSHFPHEANATAGFIFHFKLISNKEDHRYVVMSFRHMSVFPTTFYLCTPLQHSLTGRHRCKSFINIMQRQQQWRS